MLPKDVTRLLLTTTNAKAFLAFALSSRANSTLIQEEKYQSSSRVRLRTMHVSECDPSTIYSYHITREYLPNGDRDGYSHNLNNDGYAMCQWRNDKRHGVEIVILNRGRHHIAPRNLYVGRRYWNNGMLHGLDQRWDSNGLLMYSCLYERNRPLTLMLEWPSLTHEGYDVSYNLYPNGALKEMTTESIRPFFYGRYLSNPFCFTWYKNGQLHSSHEKEDNQDIKKVYSRSGKLKSETRSALMTVDAEETRYPDGSRKLARTTRSPLYRSEIEFWSSSGKLLHKYTLMATDTSSRRLESRKPFQRVGLERKWNGRGKLISEVYHKH